MPKRTNDLPATEQEFNRLRAENQVPIKPADLAGRESDLKLTSTTYGPDPVSPSDELMSALKNDAEPDTKTANLSPDQEDDVIPKVDTKAGPGLEHISAAIREDVDPLSALNADKEM